MKDCNYYLYHRNPRKCPDFEFISLKVNVYEGDIITYDGRIKATKFNIWREKRKLKCSGACKFMIGFKCYKGEKNYV